MFFNICRTFFNLSSKPVTFKIIGHLFVQVIAAVGTGYRLPAPMDCPVVLHQLMLECWKKDRNDRPRFSSILTSLDRVLRDPCQLKSTPSLRYVLAACNLTLVDIESILIVKKKFFCSKLHRNFTKEFKAITAPFNVKLLSLHQHLPSKESFDNFMIDAYGKNEKYKNFQRKLLN